MIDPMYQYSLQYIKRLFNLAIEQAESSKELGKRLEILIDKITKTVFVNVSRGLFEAHKNIFSFLISTSIKRQSKKLDEFLWNHFLRGAGVFNRDT
mmetsp:Transcript_28798/g.26018  ORF Transcript_28798/g.26018 Transcript_28798/m.26018 type:complete len:96 (-) Transcript_28798:842-1129(-)